MLAGSLLLGTSQLAAQNGACSMPEGYKTSSNAPTPQNGDEALGIAFQASDCGLNYTTFTQRLGQRFSPVGVSQPATFTIAGIPPTATVVRAFVWSDASGNGAAFNITVQPPVGPSSTYASALVGSAADKCWSYTGSYTYRADVTAAITGNGNYQLSGFPTGSPNDIDGATMMVIWRDPTATFQGDIIIHDGAIVRNNAANLTATHTITNFTACQGNVFNARAFLGVGDIQFNGADFTLNGMPPVTDPYNWWNYVDVPTTVTPGQTSSLFSITAYGDCYNFALAGLYFQSDCKQGCEYPCEAKAGFELEGCNPIQFNGFNAAGAPVVSWFWDFGDGTTSTLEDPLHTYGAPGVYNVCLTIVARGSDGKTCCDQYCRQVEACEPPPCMSKPDFNTYSSSSNPLTVVFVDAGTYAGGTVCQYTIDYGDGSPVYIGPTLPPTHTYPAPGNYNVCMEVTVCVYGPNGELIDKCSDKICKEVHVGEGGKLMNPDTDSGINVFPSPTNSYINVTGAGIEHAQVSVYNTSGQEVVKARPSGKDAYKADVSKLAPGVYFITVQGADGKLRKQVFVKE